MGGCASVDQDVKMLLKSKTKGWSLDKTKFSLYNESPVSIFPKALVVPLVDGRFDPEFLEIKKEDQEKVNDCFKQIVSGDVEAQVSKNQVVVADFKGDEKLIEGLNKVILFPIQKSPNFARENLAHLLLDMVRKCEEAKLESVTIPKLHKTGMIGTSESEICSILAKTLTVKYGRIPNAEEHVISEFKIASTNEAFNNEFVKAMDEDHKVAEEALNKENEGKNKGLTDYLTFGAVKMPDFKMPDMKMPEMKMPSIPGFGKEEAKAGDQPQDGQPNSQAQPGQTVVQQVVTTTTTTQNNQQQPPTHKQ